MVASESNFLVVFTCPVCGMATVEGQPLVRACCIEVATKYGESTDELDQFRNDDAVDSEGED